MKNILYIDYSSGFGGSSGVLYDFLKHLDRTQFHPVVAVARDGQNFKKIEELGIKVIRTKIRLIGYSVRPGMNSYLSLLLDFLGRFLPNIFILQRIIKEEKISLVHINNTIKFCVDAACAARLAGIPCVCHIRETRPPGKIEQSFSRLVDIIIVLNREMFVRMKQIMPAQKVRLVHDGIDLAVNVDPAGVLKIKDEFNLHHIFCVGIVGRIVEGKGLEDFILAALNVTQQYAHVRFLIVGSDPDSEGKYGEHLKKMAAELGLKDFIIFTGWRSDKFDIIEALDVLVQASRTPEGFGLTCVEAMVLGKPVIASNITGPSEIVEDNVTGYLVEPANPQEMAEAIKRLIASPQHSRKLGEAGRVRAKNMFDIKHNVRLVQDIYKEFK